MSNIAVYPGSFDPVTSGHLDIIKRSSRVFDKLYVSVLVNSQKNPCFSIEERMDMIRKITSQYDNVHVDSFSGLLVDYLKEKKAKIVVKGLRAVSDFEYEFQMALMNHKLAKDVETMCMVASNKYSYLSSSIVKEVARHGGNLKDLVPDILLDEISEKLKTRLNTKED